MKKLAAALMLATSLASANPYDKSLFHLNEANQAVATALKLLGDGDALATCNREILLQFEIIVAEFTSSIFRARVYAGEIEEEEVRHHLVKINNRLITNELNDLQLNLATVLIKCDQ